MIDPSKTNAYDFELPPELIAKHPSYPRGTSRLLVYNRDNQSITHETFSNIFDYIPKDTHIIINNTKVIKARLFGKKSSGKVVEIFFSKELEEGLFEVLIRGKVKAGELIGLDGEYRCEVVSLNDDGTRNVSFNLASTKLDFHGAIAMLDAIGHIPIPPYLEREDELSDAVDYQTVFAKHSGSVAAPTASLHFNDAQFAKLKEQFSVNEVTLHVGLGTFKNVETEVIGEHSMHKEFFSLTEGAMEAIRSDKHIMTIGTTATRVVEDFARHQASSGECQLFLNPYNPPQRVGQLLTNFHLPKSTLIMLVSSFIGLEETKRVYAEAIAQRYRFFSYGDAMMIL